MHIISSVIFALSVNIDAFLVGMSYGIRKIHITFFQNLLISLISFVGTVLSLFLGRRILLILPSFLADYIGSGILFALGIYYMLKSFHMPENSLHSESIRPALPVKGVLLLGAALSFNNIGIGIGASISGTLLLPAAFLTFVTSIVFLLTGNQLGNVSLFRLSDRYADLLSGAALVVLGGCNLVL